MKLSKFITFGVCFVPFMALASDTVDSEGRDFGDIPQEVMSNVLLKNFTPQELTEFELANKGMKSNVDENYEHRYEDLTKLLVQWPYPIFEKEKKDHGETFTFSGKEEENRAERGCQIVCVSSQI